MPQSYFIEQKITPFANQYRVYDAGPDETKGQLIAFAHQKRLAFREEVIVYTGEDKSQEAFRIKAENVLDYHGKFIVSNPEGTPLGAVRKNFKASLLRSTYEMFDGDEVVCVVREASVPLAVFRRIWGFIPYIGGLPFFLKYHFEFISPDESQSFATYTKTNLMFDHYRFDISDPALTERLGWQTLVAQAILLDALQGR